MYRFAFLHSKFQLLIVFFLFYTLSLHAQQTLTGTVTDAANGDAMPFVTVAVAGTANAINTDIDGKYSLQNVSANDTLLFSFVGYALKRVKVGTQTVINVKLSQSTKNLNEVVVTALGVKRQKRELGYSTEAISGKEIQLSNSSNILNAITGKSAGVQITNPDGVDGGTTRITIRGNNNIDGNNQPLIVVDNIPIVNNPGMTDVGRGQDWGSAINNINMNDVEDINILKGGAASALYGARGANGVILITMKKGKKQKGLGISYNMSYKIVHPYRFRDVQNKYGGGAPSPTFAAPAFEIGADGIPLHPTLGTDAEFGYPGSAVSWGPEMNGQTIRWWDGELRPWSPQPDNLKLPFKDGYNATHNIAFEGGGDIGNMRVSITRTDNSPIVYNSKFNQTTINTNSTLKVSDKISLNLSLSYIDYQRLNTPSLGEDATSFTKGLLYSFPRSYAGEDLEVYELADGTRNPQDGFPYLYVDKYLWWKNYHNNTTLDRTKLLGGVSLNYQVTKWLQATGRLGTDLTTDEYITKNEPADLIGLLDGKYAEKNERNKSINSEFLFTASRDSIFNSAFNVSLSAGGSRLSNNFKSLYAESGTWYYPYFYSLNNFSPNEILTPKVGLSREKVNSIFTFLNIGFKNYLFLELTGRNDWSSTLPANSNSYFYPGASLSFIATDAFKIKSNKLNFLKLRVAAAQTATDAEPFDTEFTYNTTLFGGQQSSTFNATIPPIGLEPPRVNAYEGGIIFGLFDDRVTLDFTYYNKNSFNQIISLSVPSSTGAPKLKINNGVLSNKGFELIVNTTIIKKENWVFKTGFNIGKNKNKVVSLGETNAPYILADIWGQNGPTIELLAGDDYGTITGWDYVYKDGQPVVNAEGTDYLISDKRVAVGNSSPKFLAGWNAELRYKNFALTTLIDTKYGGDMYCGSYVIGLQTGQSPETLMERDGGGLPYTDANGNTSNIGVILSGVHEDGSVNTTVVHYYHKYLPNKGGWGPFLTKPGIVENTWVKLREVTLSYNLPAKIVSRLKVFQSLSFSATARDLFYIYTTVPDNINPESNLGSGNAQGFEWGSLPGVRSFSFGINARF